MYVSSYCHICGLYMCPHTAIYVSSYCYICVLIHAMYVASYRYRFPFVKSDLLSVSNHIHTHVTTYFTTYIRFPFVKSDLLSRPNRPKACFTLLYSALLGFTLLRFPFVTSDLLSLSNRAKAHDGNYDLSRYRPPLQVVLYVSS